MVPFFFLRLREAVSIAAKLDRLESRVTGHDEKIKYVFEAVRELMHIPEKPKKSIGFTVEKK